MAKKAETDLIDHLSAVIGLGSMAKEENLERANGAFDGEINGRTIAAMGMFIAMCEEAEIAEARFVVEAGMDEFQYGMDKIANMQVFLEVMDDYTVRLEFEGYRGTAGFQLATKNEDMDTFLRIFQDGVNKLAEEQEDSPEEVKRKLRDLKKIYVANRLLRVLDKDEESDG